MAGPLQPWERQVQRLLADAYAGDAAPSIDSLTELRRQVRRGNERTRQRSWDELVAWSEQLSRAEQSLNARELAIHARNEAAATREWQLQAKAERLARWEHALVGCSVALCVMLGLLLLAWGLHQ